MSIAVSALLAAAAASGHSILLAAAAAAVGEEAAGAAGISTAAKALVYAGPAVKAVVATCAATE